MTKAKKGQLVVVEIRHSYQEVNGSAVKYSTFEAMCVAKTDRAGMVKEATNAYGSPVKIEGRHTVYVVPAEMMAGFGARGVMMRLADSYETLDEIRAAVRAVLTSEPMVAA
jgi:hypothetical protein